MARTTTGAKAARAIVDGIRDNLGYPSRDFLGGLSDAQREELFRLLRKKDDLIGASVISLSKSLYTSKARFVFELLQNAEDNGYSKALNNNEKPQVTFHVYDDRVIQECNEDGFNEANLTAICNIGKSSKATSQTYIGEKGIGFKSVFMVAYRAYIQSGDFSFFFEHHPNDFGLGMIAPQWQETTDHLGSRMTRITLLLHKEGSAEELAKQGELIRKQFEQIHEAILLFMSKLKEIKIVFYLKDGGFERIEKTIVFSVEYTGPKTTVKKTITENGETTEEVKHYLASTHLATGLAKNENRKYSNEDIASQSYSKSNVTLAFPLTSEGEPLLDTQWVFAYLPTCRMGFKFLIQADFVTQANREGIVATSARNESLMLGIAHAFIQAIQAMRQVPALRFKWMRYLPKEDDYPWDDTWSKLIRNIAVLLKDTKILESADEDSSLKLLRESRQHKRTQMDIYGRPLLPDKKPSLYISLLYRRQDLAILEDFGLKYTNMSEILQRAKWDLEQPISRIKTVTDRDMQSRLATLLISPFEKGWLSRQDEVRQLQMLHLRDNTWCMSLGNSVYFSRLEGAELDIPDGLGWNVLDSSVELVPKMTRLYELIGVKRASVAEIRKMIAEKYSSRIPSAERTLAFCHLQFLYQTHHLVQDYDIYQDVQFIDNRGLMWNLNETRMYISDREPWGVRDLLKPKTSTRPCWNGAKGRPARYLHSSYFENIPEKPTEQSLRWKEWLYQTFDIHRRLPLLNDERTGLSDDCKYLAQNRPDRFIGFLHSVWDAERSKCHNEAEIIRQLSAAHVFCRRYDTGTAELGRAYWPSDKLAALCDRFLLQEEFFPFILCPTGWETIGASFGLGYQEHDSISFLLDLIQVIENNARERYSEPSPERMYDFYLYLQAECRQSQDYEASCEKIRASVLADIIFIPGPGDNEWDEPSNCVWEAPNGLELQLKFSLAERYDSFSVKFKADKPLFADLFLNMLKIAPKCTWQDLVEELKYLKSDDEDNFSAMHKLYECIFSLDLKSEDKKQLRAIFATEALIYDDTSGRARWHETSHCLWSSAVNIKGMFAINSLYEDLKPFFVHVLGVQTRTAGMVYKKLVESTGQLDFDDIRNTIEVFSALLESEDGSFDPKPVLENNVFPVITPDGGLELRTAHQEFVMRDRKQLSDDFANKACFLDFDMGSVRRLQAFIEWAGLEGRYISNAVKEIASVDIGSTRPISKPALQIRDKAHALTRIAVSFNSPRLNGNDSELYKIFQTSETLETDKITSKLILNQQVPHISVEKESAMLYIPDHASELRVYLTSDEIQQESCFSSKLPRRLAQWIMSEPDRPLLDPVSSQMVAAVQSVLCVSRRALPTVLDEHGIVAIDLVDEEEEFSSALQTRDISAPTTTHAMATYQSSRSNSHITRVYTPPVYYDGSPSQMIDGTWSPIVPVFEGVLPSNDRYPYLLSQVVRAARRTIFPAHSSNTDDEDSESENHYSVNSRHDPFDLRSYTKLERDIRVGAAGELFIFELLSSLDPTLPGFTRDNWKSNIRHYINSHQDYADIQPWIGRETSDMVYKDSTGVLTNLLIEEGYLDRDTCEDQIIQYYLEVKTTTGKSEAPFFMSNPQYNRMRDYSLINPEFQSTKKLYVIFRVYDLTEEAVGLQVLVDPAAMEQDGLLSFTADTWSGVIN